MHLEEKAMAPHSSTFAWKIPWTEKSGRLQSMGSLRVGHDLATSLSLFTTCIGEGNGNPLQCSCLENPRDGEAWWAAVCGVAQSWTRLKRLSSSSICKTLDLQIQYSIFCIRIYNQIPSIKNPLFCRSRNGGSKSYISTSNSSVKGQYYNDKIF